MSDILTKVTSVNPSLGVTVMVPNSLDLENFFNIMVPKLKKINTFQDWQMVNIFLVLD